jgi:hypothetical protein
MTTNQAVAKNALAVARRGRLVCGATPTQQAAG